MKARIKNKEYSIDFRGKEKQEGLLNGEAFQWDVAEVKKNYFHILKDNRSYLAEVLKTDPVKKTFVIRVNGSRHEVQVSDRYDELLHSMGMDAADAQKVKEVKAPMPGLVLDIAVEAGQLVKTGDALLVLEAMKMENILKSPADGIVKKINVKRRDTVEKNAVLIHFE